MKDSYKKQLAEKLKIAKQKSQRNNIIRHLPLPLADVLKNRPYMTTPKLETILMGVNQKWGFALHTHEFIKKYPDNRIEVSWEKDVLQFVASTKPTHKHACLLTGFENSPLFIVERHWVVQHFQALWEGIGLKDLWLFDEELTFGLLICRYGGYIEHDPNPGEYFYAITYWGE